MADLLTARLLQPAEDNLEHLEEGEKDSRKLSQAVKGKNKQGPAAGGRHGPYIRKECLEEHFPMDPAQSCN